MVVFGMAHDPNALSEREQSHSDAMTLFRK